MARREQYAISMIASALEDLRVSLSTYDVSDEELARLESLADALEAFAEEIEEKDAAQ